MIKQPWDRPGLPAEADETPEQTYVSVGAALSMWEGIESELSHLYASFVGKMWSPEAYDAYYVGGKTTKNRIYQTEVAAEEYFVRHSNQEVEGQFSEIIRAVSGFADRRHEIAHGIVRPIQWYWSFLHGTMRQPEKPEYSFCLVPPHYQRSWINNNVSPTYIYTSVEINGITNRMHQTVLALIGFRGTHFPRS